MNKKTIRYYDQRMVKRYMDKGIISKADYDKFLSGLSCDDGNYEEVNFDELEESELAAAESYSEQSRHNNIYEEEDPSEITISEPIYDEDGEENF